jgi:hypothetical protein
MADGFDKMSEMAGALDTKYSNLGAVAEGMWRKFEVGIAPAGEAILGFVNDNLPAVEGLVNSVSGAVVTFIGQIPLAFAATKKAWDEDLGGMRTAAEEFMTLDQDFEVFWGKVNSAFDEGGQSNEDSWAEFLANSTNVFTSWVRLTLETLGTFFENWGNTQDAWQALTEGDWSTFWASIGGNFENAFDAMLNYIEFVFGVNLRDYLVQGMTDAWDGMKDTWNDIKEWWDNTFGGLFGSAPSSFTPDFAVVNPANRTGGYNQVPSLNPGAFSGQGSQWQMQPESATNNIVVNMTNGGYEHGFSAGEGILDAMRFRGQ